MEMVELNHILNQLIVVAFISFRLLPIFVVSPVASFRRVPMMVRVVLIIMLSVVIAFSTEIYIDDFKREQYLLIFLGEFLIGLSLAFSFHSASAAIHTLGSLVDLQIGFSAASIFDPNTEQMVTPTGELLTFGLMAVFFSYNVHHDLLVGFSKLFSIFPPGQYIAWNPDWIKILGVFYVIGFIIVSPVILTLWFTDLILAFISRSLPQTPIYFVGLPIKILVGIIMLSWFVNQAVEPFLRIFSQSISTWDMMFKV